MFEGQVSKTEVNSVNIGLCSWGCLNGACVGLLPDSPPDWAGIWLVLRKTFLAFSPLLLCTGTSSPPPQLKTWCYK